MRGMSVQQYIRYRRLAAVRYAITNNESRRCIGRIAKAYGFQHLGEFAQEYRRQYGERPSETTGHEGEPPSAVEPNVDLDGWSVRTATDIKGTGAGA
jgi:AraC-like DNA-binding protein